MRGCVHRITAGVCSLIRLIIFKVIAVTCTQDSDCEVWEFCEKEQLDSNENGCGDACECMGDFVTDMGNPDPNQIVNSFDSIIYKAEYGRGDCEAENPCDGDFDCNGYVNSMDSIVFKSYYGRQDCPICDEVECVY